MHSQGALTAAPAIRLRRATAASAKGSASSCKGAALSQNSRAGYDMRLRHDSDRRKEPALALIPRRRGARDYWKRMFGRVLHKPSRAEFPQSAGFCVKTRKPDPAISHERLDCRTIVDYAPDTVRRCFHDDAQSRRLMNLHHLPRKACSQVA